MSASGGKGEGLAKWVGIAQSHLPYTDIYERHRANAYFQQTSVTPENCANTQTHTREREREMERM